MEGTRTFVGVAGCVFILEGVGEELGVYVDGAVEML